ncbi:phytanoyl-CoA dioxygenase [Roseibium denhamense]|uniref:Phytanoyl-CoA dioxygenase (PhyH) n=1 Tax=Roseibium denhamense TaxID=76305 RepID=A0ABY1N665_9HYPH|nr:phytanoyl-CoA dioxygenase family protein [Roseibium denhamense]MTI06079.1 phytanoyl-CoA dioxygenase [Roseibium denhamense]SMP01358.1 Phytanoyl-CoA dioxygenase (PhyH) [Roseibium denhamense]
MSPVSYLKAPLWVLGLAGTDKSPRKNPILGSKTLNTWGLHKHRVKTAAAMAAWRRQQLGRYLDPADKAFFDENGYFLIKNFLPDAVYGQLKDEVFGQPFETREMRQGQTVTRMTLLPPAVLKQNAALQQAVQDPGALAMIRYASSRGGNPVSFIQTVLAEPQKIQKKDPQSDAHADTFHATSKAWLFLQDVGEEDGPFFFVPGSHKLTPERLNWEYECSLTAASDPRSHHASGSFRIRREELSGLGLPQPVKMAVPENTLIVADTFAFHGRTPSAKPTVRSEIHWHMRRNPFLPWTGLDVKSLPFVKGREMPLFMSLADFAEAKFNQRNIWRPVGSVDVRAPAQI